MINLNKIEKFINPYPIVVVDNFFNDEFLKKILDDFPTFKEFIKFKKTMVNRHFLSNENPDFFSYINKHRSFEEFYYKINSSLFYNDILNLLVDKNSLEYKKFKNLNFNQNYFVKKKFEFNLIHYFRQFTQLLPRNNFLNILRNKTKSLLYKKKNGINTYYLRLDISSASDGYNRKPHKDSDGTIIAFLIYLEDKDKIGGSGGNFIVNDNNMNNIIELEPKKNRAVFFLSNSNSYHSVSEMKNTKEWRKFIYGGFTSVDKNIWSNYNKD